MADGKSTEETQAPLSNAMALLKMGGRFAQVG